MQHTLFTYLFIREIHQIVNILYAAVQETVTRWAGRRGLAVTFKHACQIVLSLLIHFQILILFRSRRSRQISSTRTSDTWNKLYRPRYTKTATGSTKRSAAAASARASSSSHWWRHFLSNEVMFGSRLIDVAAAAAAVVVERCVLRDVICRVTSFSLDS